MKFQSEKIPLPKKICSLSRNFVSKSLNQTKQKSIKIYIINSIKSLRNNHCYASQIFKLIPINQTQNRDTHNSSTNMNKIEVPNRGHHQISWSRDVTNTKHRQWKGEAASKEKRGRS